MRTFLLAGLAALAIAGCAPTTAQPAAGPSPTTPEAFLKWSMDQYASMPAYQADAVVTMTAKDAPIAPTQTRQIRYVAPNKFSVVATRANGFKLTSVSNGEKLVEYANVKDIQPTLSPAPDHIDDVASVPMRDPMFCGSLLWQFFGGSVNYPSLVTADSGPVTFGEEQPGDGEKARVVKFYVPKDFGHVAALIGEKTGHVYRIVYDSEPVVKALAKSGGLKGKAIEAGKRHIAAMKPGPERDKAQKALDQMAKTSAPTEMISTETYSHINTSSSISATTFDITLPDGMVAVEMGAPDTDKPPVPIGRPAPEFEVAGMDGKPVKLSSLRGHVVLLDFWATWCPPCKKGLPDTANFAKIGEPGGLKVLAISGEDAPTVSKFLGQQSYKLPAFIDGSGNVAKAYQANAIPTVAVIDAQGNLSAYFVGLQEEATIADALKKAGAKI